MFESFNLFFKEQSQPGWWAAEIVRMKAKAPQTKSPSPEGMLISLPYILTVYSRFWTQPSKEEENRQKEETYPRN